MEDKKFTENQILIMGVILGIAITVVVVVLCLLILSCNY